MFVFFQIYDIVGLPTTPVSVQPLLKDAIKPWFFEVHVQVTCVILNECLPV